MNYIDKIAEQIGEECNMGMDDNEDRRLLRIYALLCLTTGAWTTLENVHNAWSVWQAEELPNHRSLIPFGELCLSVQKLDEHYRDAIVKVARSIPSVSLTAP